MKKGFYFFLLSLLFISPGCKEKKEKANEYNIIPKPNQLIPQEGRFTLSKQVKVVTTECSPEVVEIADNFIDQIALTSGITLDHILNESVANPPFIIFRTNKDIPSEGYKLSITKENVVITASQPSGFFYGVQTIYQLLPPAVYGNKVDKRADWSLPAVEITDSPRFSYRGMMLDVCRNFSSVEYVKKFIDMLAMHKMNTFHWHLTDDQGWRIEIKKYPELTNIGANRKETLVDYYYTNYPQIYDGQPTGGYYTQEEIKDIVAYAASKYITVIPEIEMPGHALSAIASYPHLSCTPDSVYDVPGTWGIFEEVYCPKEETFEFLEGVIDEVVELFPSPYIHVGGDECYKTAWKNCSECQALIKKLGLKDDTTPSPVDGKLHTKEEKLQSYVITRMEKYINSKGKNIIGWDEILEGGLAPNATVMSWQGVEGGMNAAKQGHNAIMTPSPYMYLDYYQEDPETAPITIGGYVTLKMTYNYNPVEDSADELVKKHIIGVQGNAWTEYMQTDDRRDYQIFPKLTAISETAWTEDKNKNWTDYCKRLEEEYARMDILGVNACRNYFDVNVNTKVLDDNLMVILDCFNPTAEVRYTIDGSTPTVQSTLYTVPFELTGNIDLKAAAFKDGKRIGEVRHKPLYGNLISGKPFTTNIEIGWAKGDILGENDFIYGDTVTMGLTNGKRGNNASYIPWTFFDMDENNKELIFTVKLDEVSKISKVVFGSLYNPAFRMMPVGAVTVEVSEDGENYTKIAHEAFERQYPEKGRKAYTDVVTFEPIEALYVRMVFANGGTLRNGIDCRRDTPGEILQADLCMDGIEIY